MAQPPRPHRTLRSIPWCAAQADTPLKCRFWSTCRLSHRPPGPLSLSPRLARERPIRIRMSINRRRRHRRQPVHGSPGCPRGFSHRPPRPSGDRSPQPLGCLTLALVDQSHTPRWEPSVLTLNRGGRALPPLYHQPRGAAGEGRKAPRALSAPRAGKKGKRKVGP